MHPQRLDGVGVEGDTAGASRGLRGAFDHAGASDGPLIRKPPRPQASRQTS